jgi:hypothetical protein
MVRKKARDEEYNVARDVAHTKLMQEQALKDAVKHRWDTEISSWFTSVVENINHKIFDSGMKIIIKKNKSIFKPCISKNSYMVYLNGEELRSRMDVMVQNDGIIGVTYFTITQRPEENFDVNTINEALISKILLDFLESVVEQLPTKPL